MWNRLKAELQGIRERELSTIPENKEMKELLLEQTEQQTLQEHKETVAFLRAIRADTVESLRKSEAEYSQLQQINEEMKVRACFIFIRLFYLSKGHLFSVFNMPLGLVCLLY